MFNDYDPYFNYRATVYLVEEGFVDFMNWIDSRTWYPIGRNVGQFQLSPGLISTSAVVHGVMNYAGLPINVRNACVYLSPIFSGATACSTFLLASEVLLRQSFAVLSWFETNLKLGCGYGLWTFRGCIHGHSALLCISINGRCDIFCGAAKWFDPDNRSSGMYDSEAVALFAMITTFYFFIKAIKSGSLGWSVGCCLTYYYVVCSSTHITWILFVTFHGCWC